MNLNRFPKYQQNLGYKSVPVYLHEVNGVAVPAGRVVPSTEWRVYSYNTHVATKQGDRLVELSYHSVTTRKHINYAAEQLGLRVQHCQ